MKTLLSRSALALTIAFIATAAGAEEVVTVTAPRPHEAKRSAIGAEIVNVSLSRDVRYDDLDLRTDRGARELRSRVRRAASVLCRQLDAEYLVTEDDATPCASAALDDAMHQADVAIGSARS